MTTIKFEFDEGDLVWFISDDKITSGEITHLCFDSNSSSKPFYVIENCYELYEDEIFSSKKELLEHMLKECDYNSRN